MPDQNTDADAKLRKLGQRLRQSQVVPPLDPEARRKFNDFVQHEWPKAKPVQKPVPKADKNQQKPRGPGLKP